MKPRVLRGLWLGCLLGCAAVVPPGRASGWPGGSIERLQSEDDPEPGQNPEEQPGHQPGMGSEEPGSPKPPSDPPFSPAPYFPELPGFMPDEPYVP